MKKLIDYHNVDIQQQELVVLRDVDFELKQGEFVYLLGEVGSGKSSLLKSFYAEVPIKKGEAKIFDYDLRTIKRKDIPFLRRKIGIIFDFSTVRRPYGTRKFGICAESYRLEG